MQNSGRFQLDDMDTVTADDLVAGDVFIHDGAAWACNGVVQYNDEWHLVHARPWGGGSVQDVYVYKSAKVALLT